MKIADSTVDGRAWPYEWVVDHDSVYLDGMLAQKSLRDLFKLKELDQPFFFAVGFLKPHLPFNAPQKYWDLYPIERYLYRINTSAQNMLLM